MVLALGAVICLLGAVFSLPAAHATVVYFNDFSTAGPYAGWSAATGTPLQTTAPLPPNQQFLGTDSVNGISSNTMTLALTGLPSHTGLTVEFDLYIIRSWDGNNTSTDTSTNTVRGPDVWQFAVGAQTLVNTTFSNVFIDSPNYNQSYSPTNLVGPGNFAPQTGASAIDTLKYPDFFGTNAVYHFVFNIPDTLDSVNLVFTGLPTQSITDENWGLDNVKVSTIPLPPSAPLLGSGLVGLALLGRRFRKTKV